MATAKLTAIQAAIINQARSHASDADRKAIKKEIFSVVKEKFGIDADIKVKAETDPAEPDYLLLKDKSGQQFVLDPQDGQWNGTFFLPAPVQDNPPASISRDDFTADQLRGAYGAGLPDGVRVVAQDDDNVLITYDQDGGWECAYDGGGRYLLTRD